MSPTDRTRHDEILKVFKLLGPRLKETDKIGMLILQYGRIQTHLLRGDDVTVEIDDIEERLAKIQDRLLKED